MSRVIRFLDWATDAHRLDLMFRLMLRNWKTCVLLTLLIPYSCGLATGVLLP